MTDREIKNARKVLPLITQVPMAEWTKEYKQLYSELSCRDMINSILCYNGPAGLKGNRYLQSYIDELGEAIVSKLCEEQIKDFRMAVVLKNVHIDNEGVSYNSVIWADEMVDKVLTMAMEDLRKKGDSVGYSTPDEKYHIFIQVESYVDVMEDNSSKEVLYYFIEPNWLDDGCADPMDKNTVAAFNNIDELRAGIIHCVEVFADDREEQVKGVVVDEIIADASVKSEAANKDNVKSDIDIVKE